MTKPEEIEGSAARAADRGSEQGFEAFAIEERALDLPNLNAPEDAENCVKEFCAEVISLTTTGIGSEDQEEYEKGLWAICDRYAGFFLGSSPDRYVTGSFNTPTQLGEYLRRAYGVEAEPDRAPSVMLMHCAGQVVSTMGRHLEGKIGDDAAIYLTMAAVDEASRALMGLQPSSMDDGEGFEDPDVDPEGNPT